MDIVKARMQDRAFRVNYIMETLAELMRSGALVEKEKFLANICLTLSLSRRTVLEYLQMLENSGRIIIRGKNIWTPGALRAQEIVDKAAVPVAPAEKKEV